ncbi:MAG: hypothetical protein AB3N14_10970 [Flavobacteriaceae bacterium]
MIALKLLIILYCLVIAYEDFKERAVIWIVFPVLGICMGLLHLLNSSVESFFLFGLTNTLMISAIILILFLYTKYVTKKQFLNTSLGLGDILFFYALGIGFPPFTFVVIFTAAMLFSLLFFVLSKKLKKQGTVPLAGLMGIFLIAVITASFFTFTPPLFII